jgi:hypothetical protein
MSSIDLDRIEDCLEYIRVLENNLSHARDKAHNAYTSGRAAGAAEERARIVDWLQTHESDEPALFSLSLDIREGIHVPPADPAKEDSDE